MMNRGLCVEREKQGESNHEAFTSNFLKLLAIDQIHADSVGHHIVIGRPINSEQLYLMDKKFENTCGKVSKLQFVLFNNPTTTPFPSPVSLAWMDDDVKQRSWTEVKE